ncbi:hypothetical protein PV10_03138 [Exophiala mesophila]|uniref:Uncharacterized protein n=1 Tax=Exophiala mesophila TaxID=212818 RepID=A0A0D1Y4A2_EXOME|nr:uncharacterized protein PV10_03138 [Exophiala mesophila]KIV95486.1 hypothetical protein PV10_03138 [Exophiala mesophila]
MSFFTIIPPLIKADLPPPHIGIDLNQGVAYFHCSTSRCYKIWGIVWDRNVRPRAWPSLSDFFQQSHSTLCEECRQKQRNDPESGGPCSTIVSAKIEHPSCQQLPHSNPTLDLIPKTQNESNSLGAAEQKSAEDLDYNEVMVVEDFDQLPKVSQGSQKLELSAQQTSKTPVHSESEWVVVDGLQKEP